MEVCAGFERIAIENTTTRGDDLLEIGKGREAQMICHMRHGSPPRLMAPEPIWRSNVRESHATPSHRNGMIGRIAGPTYALCPTTESEAFAVFSALRLLRERVRGPF